MSPEISIIVPTYNESNNIEPLIRKIEAALPSVDWEIIFVDDDSPDGTTQVVRQLAANDQRLRCICRVGRRGLSSACIEGMLSSSSPYMAVLDADMQHDISLLSSLLNCVRNENYDIAIGSRYVKGGSAGAGLTNLRRKISQVGCYLGNWVTGEKLTDPMSGFFVIRRQVFEETVRNLSGRGFKILVDIFASASRKMRFVELPYVMEKRVSGESKLSEAVIFHYLIVILTKGVFKALPLRYLMFALVGLSGVGVHLLVLWALHQQASFQFLNAYVIAALSAMTSNYYFNNKITFLENSMAGIPFYRGLVRFYAICGLGAMLSAMVSSYMYEELELSWLYAGGVGVIFSSVWNFSLSSIYVWERTKDV